MTHLQYCKSTTRLTTSFFCICDPWKPRVIHNQGSTGRMWVWWTSGLRSLRSRRETYTSSSVGIQEIPAKSFCLESLQLLQFRMVAGMRSLCTCRCSIIPFPTCELNGLPQLDIIFLERMYYLKICCPGMWLTCVKFGMFQNWFIDMVQDKFLTQNG